MEEYLRQVLPTIEEPRIYRMWDLFQHSGRVSRTAGGPLPAEGDESLRNDYTKLQKEFAAACEERDQTKEKLLESQNSWTLFSKDVLAISKSLYGAITALRKGQQVSEAQLNTSHLQIEKYEAFLNSNQAAFSESRRSEPEPEPSAAGSSSVKDSPAAVDQLMSPAFGPPPSSQPVEIPEVPPETQLPVPVADYPQINYERAKRFLLASPDELKICALLQALRWRITRNRKRSGRMAVMGEFVREDLLGCGNAGDILKRLLTARNKKYAPSHQAA